MNILSLRGPHLVPLNIVAAIVLAARPVAAQTAAPDTVLALGELIQRTALENPLLMASRLEAEARWQTAPQQSSLDDPMLMVMIPPRPLHTARGAQRSQWRLEQAFPFPGKRGLRGEIADLDAQVAELATETLAQELAMQVRMAYADLFEIQEQRRLIAAFRDDVQRFEEAAASQYEVGRGPQQALLRAQLEKNMLSQRDLALRTKWQEAAARLSRLTDEPELARRDLVLDRPTGLENAPRDASLERAAERRPELLALRTSQAQADHAVGLARKERYPDFNFILQYTDIVKSSPPVNPDGVDAFSIGAGVRIPLWRGRIRAGIEEKRVARRQLDAQLEALTLEIETEIAELRRRIALHGESLSLLSEGLIPQAEITRDATLAAYTTGKAAFIDLLDAERALFSLHMEETSVRAELHRAVASLQRAVGHPDNL